MDLTLLQMWVVYRKFRIDMRIPTVLSGIKIGVSYLSTSDRCEGKNQKYGAVKSDREGIVFHKAIGLMDSIGSMRI